MDSVKSNSQKLFFLAGERIGIIVVFFITLILVVSNTTIKVYSESEEKSYRQENLTTTANIAHKNSGISAINHSPEAENAYMMPISMSYEVDKITPTPTPVFDPANDAVWLQVAECESHQNWKDDTGNGYYGGLQFSLGAWASVGGSGKPSDASAEEQIMRGKSLQKVRGWGAWGACSKKLGLR